MSKIVCHINNRQLQNIYKGVVLAGLGGKGLSKRNGKIGPVNPFLPKGTQKLSLDAVK